MWAASSAGMNSSVSGVMNAVATRTMRPTPLTVRSPKVSPGTVASIMAKCSSCCNSLDATTMQRTNSSSNDSEPSTFARIAVKKSSNLPRRTASNNTSRPPGKSRYTVARETHAVTQMSSMVTLSQPHCVTQESTAEKMAASISRGWAAVSDVTMRH